MLGQEWLILRYLLIWELGSHLVPLSTTWITMQEKLD